MEPEFTFSVCLNQARPAPLLPFIDASRAAVQLAVSLLLGSILVMMKALQPALVLYSPASTPAKL